MRIAVFSDIHGNIFALNAVFKAIRKEGHFDQIIVAGDLALGGSDPAGCIDLLRQKNVLAVYGNTEKYILEPDTPPPDELHLNKWGHLRAQVDWIIPQLGEERLAWLRTLPFDLRFSPTNLPKDNLLIFHSNPKNIVNFIYPPVDKQVQYFGEILQPDESQELFQLFEGVTARTCVFGHMHLTSTRYWHGFTLINVAPCSLPELDKDNRARFTILEWKNNHWHYERRFVAYDYEKEKDALRRSDMPKKLGVEP